MNKILNSILNIMLVVMVLTIVGTLLFVYLQTELEASGCIEGERGKAFFLGDSYVSEVTCIDGEWKKDFWDDQKHKVEEAKKLKEKHEKALKEMQDFCGKDNVWTGGWDYDNYGVFGCKDYSIVELK